MTETFSNVTGDDAGRGIEMGNSELVARYNIIDPSNPAQVFESEQDVRDYVHEYAINQGFYPGDANDIDEIARRIWDTLSE